MKANSNFVIEFLSSDGKISSKRVALAASLFFYLFFAASEQFFNFKANHSYMEGLTFIVEGCLLATASEKFSKKSKEKENGSTSTKDD